MRTTRYLYAALALIVLIAACFSLFVMSAAAVNGEIESVITLKIGSPTMLINNVPQLIDDNSTVPIVQNDRTLLPVRSIIEAIGCTVEWDGGKGVTLNRGEDVILLTLGNKTAYLNGKAYTLDAAPVAVNNRTMLPIRFIAENLGCEVDWNASSPLIVTVKYREGATFDLNETVYNGGAQVTQVVIKSKTAIDGSSLTNDSFKVTTKNSLPNMEVENGEIDIINAFVSDNKDLVESDEGKYIVLELDPNSAIAKCLAWDDPNFTNRIINLNYTATQVKDLKTTDGSIYRFASLTQDNILDKEVDAFGAGKSSSGLNYRDYEPVGKSSDGTHPLIIWLHGGGEGGNNNATTLMANRGGLTFATAENQKRFDYPYVLVPQAPDFWMLEFPYGDMVCIGDNYAPAVVSLIKEYINAHDDIDPDRVLVVGASMGGYQTWATVAEEPSLFTAMIPLCTAQAIDQSMVDACKDVPAFISHSTNDAIVSVNYSKNAYNRLVALGANPIFIELDEIVIDGVKYDYHDGVYMQMAVNGIFSNDGTAILDWAAEQLGK